MADIHEYQFVAFNTGVQPKGMAKLIKLTATAGVRIFRDMADPQTLVIEHRAPPSRDEMPWANVQISRRKKEEPKVEQQSGGQKQQGGGR